METPNTPLSQQAASRADASVGKFGPELEKFFYGQLMGGNQDVSHLTAGMRDAHNRSREDTMNQIKSSGIPMGSSAMNRAFGEAMGNADADYALQAGMFQNQLRQQELQNKLQGASGLQGIPGYYAQPTSIEQAIMGMRQPYDMANFNAQNQVQMSNMDALNRAGMFNAEQMNQGAMTDRQGMMNWMTQLGMYQPERMMMPSGFDQYISPWLGPALGGLGGGFGGALAEGLL